MYSLHIIRNAVHDNMCCINPPHFKAAPHSNQNRQHQPNRMTLWDQGRLAWYTHHFTAVPHSNQNREQQPIRMKLLCEHCRSHSGMLISVSSLSFPYFNRDLNTIYFVWLYIIYLSTTFLWLLIITVNPRFIVHLSSRLKGSVHKWRHHLKRWGGLGKMTQFDIKSCFYHKN